VKDYIKKQLKDLNAKSPGEKDTESLQLLKGWIREWEAELAWAHFGIHPRKVSHLRLQFYTGDIFMEDPGSRDVLPLLKKLEQIRPDIITVAMDPESSGPDTHFKTLIAVAKALEAYKSRHPEHEIRVWGYRNVWTRFHLSEADFIIPVSLNSFAVLHNMFNTCFLSQTTASFPSYELDGTFSELAQKIWVEQFNDLIRIVDRDFFSKSKSPMLRRAFGAIYMKDMAYSAFLEETAPIKNMLRSKKNLKALA
jgi:glucosamine-6-phosphate deaminase